MQRHPARRSDLDISVIIPFHACPSGGGGPCPVLRAVAALRACSLRVREILCVDDNSTLPLRRSIERAGATYVPSPAPPATPHVPRRALARQTGADLASGEHLLFVDADILVHTRALAALGRQVAAGGSRAVVFVPRRDAPGVNRARPPRLAEPGGYCSPAVSYGPVAYAGPRGAVGQPVWARHSSHCFGVARRFLQRVGGWDTAFEGWGEEDTELFYRLFQAGGMFRTLEGPGLTVLHLPHDVDHEANYHSFRRNAHYFMAKFPEVAELRREFYVRHGILSGP